MLALILKFFASKAGKTIGVIAIVAFGAWFIRHDGYQDGRKDLQAEISEKVSEAREEEYQRYLERDKVTRASYESALKLVAQARDDSPRIIREIQNAPQTDCSYQPIGDYRLRLLNAAITGTGYPDTPSRRPARGATAAALPAAG